MKLWGTQINKVVLNGNLRKMDIFPDNDLKLQDNKPKPEHKHSMISSGLLYRDGTMSQDD